MTQQWFRRDPAALGRLGSILRSRYPTLHAFADDKTCVVLGTYAVVDGGREIDRYSLEIELPGDYPHSLPMVWETAGRIPRELNRHVVPRTGALCLGVPVALWIDLKGDFSIERVLEGPVRTFLIGNGLVEEGEPWPHGDRSHGAKGMLEFYADFLGTNEPMKVTRFLLDLVQGRVRGHWPCPCGSGQIIRKCHKTSVYELRNVPESVIVQSGSLILDLVKQERSAA